MSIYTTSGISFKRRVRYAPLEPRDLRLRNDLYLQVQGQLSPNTLITVTNPTGNLWSSEDFSIPYGQYQYSPVIHTSHAGYASGFSKKFKVGYYLGSKHELDLSPYSGFSILNESSGVVYTGLLSGTPDSGYQYPVYQQVKEGDFSNFNASGLYKIYIPNLGTSYPFFIGEGIPMNWLRTAMLGMYHLRCGQQLTMPYTIYTHEACHTNPTEVPLPTGSYATSWGLIAGEGANPSVFQSGAPTINSYTGVICKYNRTGTCSGHGSHHDAGDFGRYTTAVAQCLHWLVGAVDLVGSGKNFDNIGLPESNDGKNDLLSEAKIDADWLTGIQDTDGGFYHILRPKDRSYDNDQSLQVGAAGDTYIGYPKSTTATASAAAALAQIGSSPTFRNQYGTGLGNLYITGAIKAWDYLQAVFAASGRNSTYQKVYFYSDENGHDDNMAWAATELYLATKEAKYHTDLLTTTLKTTNTTFDPNDTNLMVFGWQQMGEEVGCAARSYGLAVQMGKATTGDLNAAYSAKCMRAITGCAAWRQRAVAISAYGNGTNLEDKSYGRGSAAWWISPSQTCDLMIGYMAETGAARQGYMDAYIQTVNYQLGCNPSNKSFLPGIGFRRPHEQVSQFLQNNKDKFSFPPIGIPIGDLNASYAYVTTYGTERQGYTFPYDDAAVQNDTFPYYDRDATDTYNVNAEGVSLNVAKEIACFYILAAQTSLYGQPWTATSGTINGANVLPINQATGLVLTTTGLQPSDLQYASIVWDCVGHKPLMNGDKIVGGTGVSFTPMIPGPNTIRVDACAVDGRRVFAIKNFTGQLTVPTGSFIENYKSSSGVQGWWKLDGTGIDSISSGSAFSFTNTPVYDPLSFTWSNRPSGQAIYFSNENDSMTCTAPATYFFSGSTNNYMSVEAMIYIKNYGPANGVNKYIFGLEAYPKRLYIWDKFWGQGREWLGTSGVSLATSVIDNYLTPNTWHNLKYIITNSGYEMRVDNNVVTQVANPLALASWSGGANVTIRAGQFIGWIDEIVVTRY